MADEIPPRIPPVIPPGTVNPVTGKKKGLPGNQRRKLRAAKKEKQLLGETGGGEAYDVLGDPDIESPAYALDYVRKAQLIAFGQICRSRTLPQMERWRLIKEHGATIGMTYSRSSMESKVKGMEAALKERSQSGSIQVAAGASIKRPPTARGGPRGPRALAPEDLAGPEPGSDDGEGEPR